MKAMRSAPPRVGLAVRVVPCTTPASDPANSDAYDVRIMHKAVPATLVRWTVVSDASDIALSQALCVPEDEVRTNWLTSRTPLEDPRPPPAPQPVGRYREGRARAPPVPLFVLQSYRDLAAELRTRLDDLDEPSEQVTTRCKDRYYAKAAPAALSIEHESSSADSGPSAVGSFEPVTHMSKRAAEGCSLELGKYVAHAAERGTLVRGAGGLYAGVRHARGLVTGECAYAELYVQYAGGQGGLAIGAAAAHFPIDSMVGGKPGSVALHSEARVVRAGHWSAVSTPGASFGTGDTVGVYVAVSARGRVTLRTWINGVLATEIAGDEVMRQAALDGERIHLQCALLRPGARVALRCCPLSWRYAPHALRNTSFCKPLRNAPNDVGSQVLTP